MSHAQYTWSSFFHPSNFICRFDDVLADFVTNQIELIVFAIFSVCHFNASLVKITGTFTRCCTCTMYDNKYIGLVLKDSREKQQKEKKFRGRVDLSTSERSRGEMRLDRPHDSESHIIM